MIKPYYEFEIFLDMEFKKCTSTKLFAKLVHYTNGDSASKIMKEGFKNKGKQLKGVSFFEDCDDHIKNNNKDLYKLSNRFLHNLKTKGRKWFQGNDDKKTGKIK